MLPEDDALSEKITKMIASLDSVESLCDFSYLEHDEAFQKMKSGELQAVFEVRPAWRAAFWTERTSRHDLVSG
mgnify:CR=1 FL=1